MLIPDLEIGRSYIEKSELPGTMLLCGVTGSHLYGFPSSDSDLDLKAIHFAPARSLLGLNEPPETFDRQTVFSGIECDFTSHEARKALRLLLGGNGNMLERIFSPFQLYPNDEMEEFRALARQSVSKQFYYHYRGYFQGMCREHIRSEPPRAKSLLYSYRAALTGVHLLQTGEMMADLTQLAPCYGFAVILDLIRFKRERGETSALDAAGCELWCSRWPELEALLEKAFQHSPLPDESPNRSAIDAWLVSRRVAALRS